MRDKRKRVDGSQAPVTRAISHQARLKLFTFLVERSSGTTTNEQELAETFGMSIGLVKYHLLVLEDANLVANIADELGIGSGSCYIATVRL